MALGKNNKLYEDDYIKAIVGIPDWANPFGKASNEAKTAVDAWSSVPLLYRAVSLRASSISSVPFVVFQGEREVDYPLEPDLASVIYQMELGLLLTGASYALKQYVGNVLTGVQVLNPTTVDWQVKHNEDRFIQRVNGKTYGPWHAEQMMAMREPSMTADRGAGLAPAEVALTASQLRFNMQAFASAFFEHGAQPQTLITTSGNPSVSEMERAQSFFKRRMTGVSNAWRALFLRGDLKVTTLTPDIKSMAMKELSDHVALDIGAALGVPRSILESDAANYATSQTDMESFWHMTIRPRLPMYEKAINEQLLANSDYSIQFAPEQLDVFQKDESLRAASLLQLVQAGVPLDDAMMMLGYDPIENRPISEEVEIEEQEPDRVLIDTELASWQRYALRNLKKQKRRAFVTKHIPDYMSDNIRMQLSQSTTAEEVRAAFEPSRFLGFTTY
jgi:HK97 family phage portal protein